MTKPIDTVRERFVKLIEGLIETLELQTRMDIRDRIAALTLVDRVLAREKPDESERAGSAVRKYTPEFQKAHGAGRREANGDSGADEAAAELGHRGIDTGERTGGPDADDDHPDAG